MLNIYIIYIIYINISCPKDRQLPYVMCPSACMSCHDPIGRLERTSYSERALI